MMLVRACVCACGGGTEWVVVVPGARSEGKTGGTRHAVDNARSRWGGGGGGGSTGKGWLILGHASEGRDHLLFVVELSWKITRGIFISEADRAAEED